jgi:hypothetical protein
MANHEKHIDDLLRDALGEYTEQPPTGAWTDMEAKLDDGKTVIDLFFAEALSDYTETPPANAWAGMEAKLGGKTEFDHAFMEALGDYTEAPPANAWADMEARLDRKPQRRRGIIWFWSAAALSGLLAVGYFFMGNNENHSAHRQAEVKTEAAIPETNTPAAPSTVEVKTETPVTIPPQTAKAQEAPKHTPVVEKTTPKQEVPVVAEKQEAPAQNNIQKEEPQAQQMPAENKDVATQNDSAHAKVNVDDIAAAIRRRANSTVMIVKKSRYADSMAQVELIAKQKEEEAAKAQPEPAIVQAPVIAATVDTIKEVAKEEAIAKPDTISAIAMEAINQTEKNMEVKQDAIPAAQITEPVEKAVFEMGGVAAKVAETSTNDPEKGSLAAFIGPVEDTEVYAGTSSSATSGDITEPIVKTRTPLKMDWFLKTGYETGLNKQTVNKFVFAPSIQIGITDKIGIILQPTIKSGKVNYSQVGNSKSYHDITFEDHDSVTNQTHVTSAQGITTTTVTFGYYYLQTYDSLVVSHRLASRSVIEAELPVLLSYDLGKNFSIYGGPVVSYSNILQINKDVQSYGSFTKMDSVKFEGQKLGGNIKQPTAPAIADVLQYNTPEIAEYNNSAYQTFAPNTSSAQNKIRMGYMLGATYNYKRLSADITVQQNLSRMNYIANQGVKSIYMQPYMRFMLGFKLNK